MNPLQGSSLMVTSNQLGDPPSGVWRGRAPRGWAVYGGFSTPCPGAIPLSRHLPGTGRSRRGEPALTGALPRSRLHTPESIQRTLQCVNIRHDERCIQRERGCWRNPRIERPRLYEPSKDPTSAPKLLISHVGSAPEALPQGCRRSESDLPLQTVRGGAESEQRRR
jgi:hypothetical protein